MTYHKREITKDQYERAMQHRGYIAPEDKEDIFDLSERLGYGVYGTQVVKEGDKYYVEFELGDSCD